MRTPAQAVEEGRSGPRRTYDRIYMRVPKGIDPDLLQMAAATAVYHAQIMAPRLSGASARRLQPIWGEDYFGILWRDNYVWFQEMGINPFLMEDRQGKAIPMWVEDPDGEIVRKNPRTKVRRTADGRVQVLIFRHKSKKGERKTVKRRINGIEQWVSVPRSYPGAPGRINKRVPGRPLSTRGGGQIARGNVGVRWRHPGLGTRFFLHRGILLGAKELGLPQGPIGVAEVREKLDVPR
jgi:hypothetical protein